MGAVPVHGFSLAYNGGVVKGIYAKHTERDVEGAVPYGSAYPYPFFKSFCGKRRGGGRFYQKALSSAYVNLFSLLSYLLCGDGVDALENCTKLLA